MYYYSGTSGFSIKSEGHWPDNERIIYIFSMKRSAVDDEIGWMQLQRCIRMT